MAAQAGWYVDPRDARQYRYWDGERWSQSTQPIPELNPTGPFGDNGPTGSLNSGGAKEPLGAAAFDDASSAASGGGNGDGVLADFMWTSGFGEATDDTVVAGPAMFTPAPPAAAAPPAPPAPAPAPPAPPAGGGLPSFQPQGTAPQVAPPPSQLSPKPMFGAGAAAADESRFAPAPPAPAPPAAVAPPAPQAPAPQAPAPQAPAAPSGFVPQAPPRADGQSGIQFVPPPPADQSFGSGEVPAAPSPFTAPEPGPAMPRPNVGASDAPRPKSKVDLYTMPEEAVGVPTKRRSRSKSGKPFPEPVPPPGAPGAPVAAAAAGAVAGGQVPNMAGGAPMPGAPVATNPFGQPGAPAGQVPPPPGPPPGGDPTGKKKKGRAKKVPPIGASGDAKAATGNKNAPKSKLPLLLGFLGVAVVGAGAFFFLKPEDKVLEPAKAKVAGTTVERGDTTIAPETTVPPAGETTVPAAGETTVPVAETTVPAPATTVAPDVARSYEETFNTEVTRACDLIKTDPGRTTESIIQYNDAWAAIGRTYESLQIAVNDCAFAARDEALKRVAEAEAANGG